MTLTKKLNALLPVFVFLCTLICTLNCSEHTDFAKLSGPYLGQTPPGKEPKLFAPGIISTGMNDRDAAFTPDGKEFYYSVFLKLKKQYMFTIMVSKEENGCWTKPDTAPFSGLYTDVEPCISFDGKTFMFCSNRPLTGSEPLVSDVNLWMMKRTESGWSEPRSVGETINTPNMEAFPSLTKDGTLYFTRNTGDFSKSELYRSRLLNGEYTEPEKLPEIINARETPLHFNAFIAWDESYLILSSYRKEENHGKADYYISFRDSKDNWSTPVNLGDTVNSTGHEVSPYVTRDGKYFFFASSKIADENYFLDSGGFFTRPNAFIDKKLIYKDLEQLYRRPQNGNQDIYWMDASFIEGLRLKSRF